jgi:cytidylate kinase
VTHKLARPNVSILISGPSRTGKTTAANILADRYGIENIKIGEEFRRVYGIHTSHHVERDPEFDRKMDNIQIDKIRGATSDDPFILEARLAAFLASQERAKRELPIVTVLFWAPEEERMERQLRKVRREKPGSTVTLQELLDGERKREAYDLEQWQRVHPALDHKNVFDPDLTDPSGAPVYDLVVDTRVGMPDAVADVVHDWLVQRGAFGGHDDKS